MSCVEGRLEPGGDLAVLSGVSGANGLTGPSCTDADGRREGAGEAKAGVEGPTCPWSSMCSRAASSWRHILHQMRRRGPPGVAGAESEGVRGNLAKKSVSMDPSPSARPVCRFRVDKDDGEEWVLTHDFLDDTFQVVHPRSLVAS